VKASHARLLLAASTAVALTMSAYAQPRKPFSVQAEPARAPTPPPRPKTAAIIPEPQAAIAVAPQNSLIVAVMLADVGHSNGLRLSNLGGQREIYIPVPQGIELKLAQLVLTLDDVSAHEARRSLEILVNDRSVSAIALDGKSSGRTVHLPLLNAAPRDGFLKVTFLYSGAATLDRCIDVRYVGDSVTIRPESAVEFEISKTDAMNITAVASLMPHNVSILLSSPQPAPADVATALTLARSLRATGRRVTFHHGIEALAEVSKREDPLRWTNGVVIVGAIDRIAGRLDPVVASAGSANYIDNSLAVARIGGAPVLLVSDAASARAGRLLGNPSLAVLRDTSIASVRPIASIKASVEQVTFDELGLIPARADVFGRAELGVGIASSSLPSGTRPSRLVLDIMVAPDGAGEKAVVTVFVNERMLASTVAATSEATRLDVPLPDGLVGTVANIRAVVQRRSAQGDCRFEPQGYPAEILGSSMLTLTRSGPVEEFSDLTTLWSSGVEVLVPASTSTRPLATINLLADVLSALSRETAPIVVKYVQAGTPPAPQASFVTVSSVPPAGATQRVHFDRGRVAVADRAGNTRLDVGGLTTGAVAQLVTSGAHSGLWIKPLTTDGSLPISPGIYLDHGDVAFLDKTGVALAMSTERDSLLRLSYPDKGTLLGTAERYRSWIVGGFWGLATILFLFVLQRIYRQRRRAGTVSE
jgi:Bacterial cellulose synthase subunit